MNLQRKHIKYWAIGIAVLALFIIASNFDRYKFLYIQRPKLERFTIEILLGMMLFFFLLHVVYTLRKAQHRRRETGEFEFWMRKPKEVLIRLLVVAVLVWMGFGVVYNILSYINRHGPKQEQVLVKGTIKYAHYRNVKNRWGYNYKVIITQEDGEDITLYVSSWDVFRYLKVGEVFERTMTRGSFGALYEYK